MSQSGPSDNPSLIGGHVQYVKGAAESLIGNVTGAASWTDSATTDKEQGVAAMKAAGQQREANQQGYGKVEEVAGKVTGCEGMVREGQESKTS
ncbi:hypothetical protein K461DRAFT_317799 [Myriangium duriaei CBS 260.36]|uniref:CsbD-like domain-containing protein n=1 Tax=Myriangium duriaei CBS 260.36 TaxID=1168546 RepID=A0A9P4MLV3_9PEZI|nr:hypothetical protein K461DRAFT_317799 [Myriangium duriaei CBS 260.36]